MSKNSMLWFCRTSDSSSLARITDSIVPLLMPKFDITLLSNKTNIKGIRHVEMGADTEYVKYKDFLQTMPGAIKNGNINEENIRCINMKYILVQLVDLVYDGNYKYVLICNGVYEIDWITKILMSDPKYLTNKNGKKTKLVVWAPIDYIPSMGVIHNVMKSDIFLTMTPVMKSEIEEILNNYKMNQHSNTDTVTDTDTDTDTATNTDIYKCKIDWVGHGSDIKTDEKNDQRTREELILELNKLKTEIHCKIPIKSTDIIILNANNYGPLNPNLDSVQNTPGTRKRLDITVKAFLKLLETNKNVKLWIHTNLKSFFEMLAIENIQISTFINNIILSNNNVTNEQLSLIYQISDISLQTSTGEGWSLTNLEASIYKSLQVVPDFLACGYHFKDRGILIPISKKIIKNEGNISVTIGEVSVNDTVIKLLEAIELLKNKEQLDKILTDACEYAKSYTWSSVANKLADILN
jgi:glycosyltransferase involved in cell wall biosynthesis